MLDSGVNPVPLALDPLSPTKTLLRYEGSTPSARASIIERRTYLRPKNEDGTEFETRDEMLDRVTEHQAYLWEQALDRPLTVIERAELSLLRRYMAANLISVSGRVKWMGGTDVVKERASAAFNCAFSEVKTPADLTDIFWLLLQGCGTGFKPVPGLLTGLPSTIKTIRVIPSTRTDKGGPDDTTESFSDGVWRLDVGDSAKGWAIALGKLTAHKYPAHTLEIGLEALRPGGKRLRGYGWLSSGWKPLAEAMTKIAKIMQERADALLTAIDIGDIDNLLGTVLSSRRSAQIWVLDDDSPELDAFINAKVDRFTYYRADGSVWNPPADFDWSQKNAVDALNEMAKAEGAANKVHREQSNNSILFHQRPSRDRIKNLLTMILEGGDPGFINAAEALRRAPDMEGVNPCGEILLPNKGFCNLMQVVWHRFNGAYEDLLVAQYLAGRANYRQTCVSMKDGVLQLGWQDNNKLLRLCGVSPTGYVAWDGRKSPAQLEGARDAAIAGANSMADELGLQRPRRVTQVQPAGTSSKVLGLEGDEVHEGAHCALSRFIFNNVNFTRGEPLVEALRSAGYIVKDHPTDPTAVIAVIPVAYPASELFTKVEKNGEILEIYQESAVDQLERYRLLMNHYVQNNASITISFDADEIEAVTDWFMEHWNEFVGVSFLKRNDPTRTAEELGFAYLPQECVSERQYRAYVDTLWPVDLSGDKSHDLLDLGECASGACPIR